MRARVFVFRTWLIRLGLLLSLFLASTLLWAQSAVFLAFAQQSTETEEQGELLSEDVENVSDDTRILSRGAADIRRGTRRISTVAERPPIITRPRTPFALVADLRPVKQIRSAPKPFLPRRMVRLLN